MTLNPDYDIRGLLAAVVIQAVKDARQGDIEAVQWLESEGACWLGVLGFDTRQKIIEKAIRKQGRQSHSSRTSSPKASRGNVYAMHA